MNDMVDLAIVAGIGVIIIGITIWALSCKSFSKWRNL
jgi:hypothetical protein